MQALNTRFQKVEGAWVKTAVELSKVRKSLQESEKDRERLAKENADMKAQLARLARDWESVQSTETSAAGGVEGSGAQSSLHAKAGQDSSAGAEASGGSGGGGGAGRGRRAGANLLRLVSPVHRRGSALLHRRLGRGAARRAARPGGRGAARRAGRAAGRSARSSGAARGPRRGINSRRSGSHFHAGRSGAQRRP